MKLYILPLLIFLLAGSCDSKEENAADQSNAPMTPTTAVETKGDTTEDQTLSIQMTGFIDVPPANRAAISPYYGGFAERIAVLPGQQVKKGEVLLVLRNPEYLEMQQAYLEAFAQLDYLKSESERQKQLKNENIASTKVMMKAEADYKQMQARANAMGEKLTMLTYSLAAIQSGNLSSAIKLRAPFNGTVTALNVTNGAFVDAREIALELINTDHIHLELDAFEKDAIWISEGQRFQFRIPELSAESFQAEVYLVTNEVNLESRTVKIHGHVVGEEDTNFIPGMFVEANLTIKESKN